MNKIKLSFICAALSLTAWSQKEVHLTTSYLPETEYHVTMGQEVESTTTYHGSRKKLKELQVNGLKNPTRHTEKSEMSTISRTGKLLGNTMPITIEYELDKKEQSAIPPGTVIYGKVDIGKMPVIDSIHSPGMKEELKQAIITVVSSSFSQIPAPNKVLKIGESYTTTLPISIPMGASNLDMEVLSIYKLNRIQGENAFFDITQVFTMKTTIEGVNLKMKGKGSGQMTYNITDKFFTSLQTTNEMELKMKLNKDISINISMLQKITQAIEIN